MPAGSSVSTLPLRSLKATRNEIDKYSGLVQSHASSPTTTTRALVSTLRTRKLHCEMQQNWPSSTIERKLYLAASHWARMKKEEIVRLKEEGNKRRLRNQQKYVQKCQRSQRVKDVRRQLCQVIFTEKSERQHHMEIASHHSLWVAFAWSSCSTLCAFRGSKRRRILGAWNSFTRQWPRCATGLGRHESKRQARSRRPKTLKAQKSRIRPRRTHTHIYIYMYVCVRWNSETKKLVAE